MGKPSQTRKERKYLKAGDLVEQVMLMWGQPLDNLPLVWNSLNEGFPGIGGIGLVLSVKRMTKRDRNSSCVILIGERKIRYDGPYWEAFKRIEQKP